MSAALLEPVDVTTGLPNLELTLGQVCQMTGVSKMQLDYWTSRAHIPTKGRKQRIYDVDGVELVMLIKQGKDKGLNLGAAIEAARSFRASAVPSSPGPSRREAADRRGRVDR